MSVGCGLWAWLHSTVCSIHVSHFCVHSLSVLSGNSLEEEDDDDGSGDEEKESKDDDEELVNQEVCEWVWSTIGVWVWSTNGACGCGQL